MRRVICTALLMITSLAAAQQSSPSTIDIKSRTEEGMAAFRWHDYKRALSVFNEVTATDPNNILAHNAAAPVAETTAIAVAVQQAKVQDVTS